MSYQVALNSRNVIAPVTLEDHLGNRYNGPLSGLITANAMVIRAFTAGPDGRRSEDIAIPGLEQEFHPIRASTGEEGAYAGREWELRAQQTGAGWFVYYLGIPDRFLAASGEAWETKSVSVELVGTSPLSGRQEFSGGVDLHLQAQVELPLIPGFINLGERFFPTLLPSNFIEKYVLDFFDFAGRRDLLLLASLQFDPNDRLPVSLGKHWDSRNWVQSVVENLDAEPSGRYFCVKGGCFFDRSLKITHWFGGAGTGLRGIGLDEPGFRAAATEKIRGMDVGGKGAWVFWLEAKAIPSLVGVAPRRRIEDLETLRGQEARHPQPRFSLRHPMLHRLMHLDETSVKGRVQSALTFQSLAAGAPASGPAQVPVSGESALSALAQVAKVLTAHQAELHRAFAEPSPGLWSRDARPANLPLPRVDLGPLADDIRELYRSHGDTLRTLETVFDETSGYAAWDSQGNPMRDRLIAYLGEDGVTEPG